MPEMVACPACGCRVLLDETQLGRRLRCIACERAFVAGEPAPVRESTTYSLNPPGVVDEEPWDDGPRKEPARHRLPLCPRCHRPVGWEDSRCPHCWHPFDPMDAGERAEGEARRDALAHRGELIGHLGRYALLGGCLAVCTGPLGILVAFGCAVPAWWMARGDLPGMDAGRIDPSGRAVTEEGKNNATAGLILALVFSLFWILVFVKNFQAAARPQPAPPDPRGIMPQITSCPECSKKLRVPDELIGKKVKCPGCATMFMAEADDQDEAPPPKKKAPPKPPAKAPAERARPDAVTSSPRARRREDEEEEEAPRARRRDKEEEEEERPSRRGRRDEREDDEDRRPRRGRLRDDDEDDEDDDRPSRRRDYEEDDDEDRPRRRRDSGQYASRREQRLGWEKVRSGTNFVLISGWLVLSLMLLYLVFTLVLSLVGGAGGFNNLSSGNMEAMGVLGCGFALVAGVLGLSAFVLLLTGTGFCMATPRLRGQTMKGMAMTAFYLYVGSIACYLVCIVLTIVFAPLGLLGIIAAALAAVGAHVVWVLYLRLVSLYFRDPGLARSLVTYLIATFVAPVLGFLLMLLMALALRSAGTAGAIIMGIFSLLLFVVNVGLLVWYLMLLKNVRDLVDR